MSNLPASFSSMSNMDTSVGVSDSELELSNSDDSGIDADDELEESDDVSMPSTHHLHCFTCRMIQDLYSYHYLNPCNQLFYDPS